MVYKMQGEDAAQPLWDEVCVFLVFLSEEAYDQRVAILSAAIPSRNTADKKTSADITKPMTLGQAE